MLTYNWILKLHHLYSHYRFLPIWHDTNFQVESSRNATHLQTVESLYHIMLPSISPWTGHHESSVLLSYVHIYLKEIMKFIFAAAP